MTRTKAERRDFQNRRIFRRLHRALTDPYHGYFTLSAKQNALYALGFHENWDHCVDEIYGERTDPEGL